MAVSSAGWEIFGFLTMGGGWRERERKLLKRECVDLLLPLGISSSGERVGKWDSYLFFSFFFSCELRVT